MMVFWLIVCVMTAVALMLILRPLKRQVGQTAPDGPTTDEIAMFRAQLAELDRDLEAGLVGDEEARTARTEIERRILRAAEAMRAHEGGEGPGGVRQPHIMVLAAVAMMPLAAVALYMAIGNPELVTGPGSLTASTATPGAAEGSMPSLELMAQRLEAKLESGGGDVEGWALLARTNIVLGHAGKAADAFRKAIDLAPDGPAPLYSGLGEALTITAGGTVTSEAKRAFETARERNSTDPAARYYLGLADYQQGNRRAAYDAWVALAESAPADAPWAADLRKKIVETAAELGLEAPQAATPALQTQTPAPPAVAPAPRRGPSAADVAAAQTMGQDDRQAMIAGMVEGLAARLAQNPDDADGWRMLARSYNVLGRLDDAARAQAQFARLRPQDAEAQLGHGLALAAAREAQSKPIGTDAQEAFKRALALDPQNPDALYYLGKAAKQRGDRTAAALYWKPLLDRLPEAAPKRAEIKSFLDGGS